MDEQTATNARTARPRRSVVGALLAWARRPHGAGPLAKVAVLAVAVPVLAYAATRPPAAEHPIQVVEAGQAVALPVAVVVEVPVTATLPNGEPRVDRIPGDPDPTGTPAPDQSGAASPAAGSSAPSSTRPGSSAAPQGTRAAGPTRTGAPAAAGPPTQPVSALRLVSPAMTNTRYAVLSLGVHQVVTGSGTGQAAVMGPLYTWGRYPVQQWTLVPYSGPVFTLAMGDRTTCLTGGAPVATARCDAGDGRQQWQLLVYSGDDPGPMLKNLGSGKCLTARTGAALALAACAGAAEQRWRMGTVPAG